ncbi:MAG TPA: hypothetical protein VKY29_05500 [Cryomorphaceae bacterium]|nr:hypothetical protein [Cryomorphaceae bacterium]
MVLDEVGDGRGTEAAACPRQHVATAVGARRQAKPRTHMRTPVFAEGSYSGWPDPTEIAAENGRRKKGAVDE